MSASESVPRRPTEDVTLDRIDRKFPIPVEYVGPYTEADIKIALADKRLLEETKGITDSWLE